MNSVIKLIRKLLGTLFIALFLVFICNLIGLYMISPLPSANQDGPLTKTAAIAKEVQLTGMNYQITETGEQLLEESDAWAILIGNEEQTTLWRSANTPDEIPYTYTLSDIAEISKTYLQGYPTFTYDVGNGDIFIVGFPSNRYWKLVNNSWDYSLIANAPMIFLMFLIVNMVLLALLYLYTNRKIISSIQPIVQGIASLANGKTPLLRETGALAPIAVHVNQTAQILQEQHLTLKKKEQARVNWIAGVSHDIRTPLSMVMGYAAQLEESPALPSQEKEKAGIIKLQSIRMKSLINDLNLSSKLEYEMQPLHKEQVNILALLREVVVDFLNQDVTSKYPIQWHVPASLTYRLDADKSLLQRAFSNLIQNSILHNPNGCTIMIEANVHVNELCIKLSDDGIGISVAQLKKLQQDTHYMAGDEPMDGTSHGLGLRIVRQIIQVHNGNVQFCQHEPHGFCVLLYFSNITN